MSPSWLQDRRPAYVCEYCGYQGRDPRPVDQVQCPMCGEPVTPVSPR